MNSPNGRTVAGHVLTDPNELAKWIVDQSTEHHAEN